MSKKIKRTHDKLYLKDLRYFKKPKFSTSFFFNLIKNKKFKSLMDIGCSNGSFLKYLSYKLPSKTYLGTDTNKNLLNFAKKKNNSIKFVYDDITKTNYRNYKADIIHCAGVLNIFDNVDNTLKQLINRCNSKGCIYVLHYFNDFNIDYLTRYRDNINSKNNKINEMGWNVFSKATISKILRNNKKVLSFKFIEINFPKNLIIKKSKKDLMRSWTTVYNKQKYFVNGLNFFNKLYFLKIKLK